MEQRPQKILSAHGICSRRAAEEYIRTGRLTINGAPASLGCRIDPARDRMALDGKPLHISREIKLLYLMLNKPAGYVVTASDERGRPTVMDLIRGCGARVFNVGRLDMDSEGLLLLTNDGDLAQTLAHPRHQMEKEYHVTVSGALSGCCGRLAALTALEDGTPVTPAKVEALGRGKGRLTLRVTIHQGRNRQIRRMCAMAGLRVERLIRVREGSLQLGDLPRGCWRYLTETEVAALTSTDFSENRR